MLDDRDAGPEQQRVGGPLGVVGRVDVERVDAHERGARGHQQLHGVGRQERVVVQVGLGAPEPVEPRVDEDRPPGQLMAGGGIRVDGRCPDRGGVDADGRQVDQALGGKPPRSAPSSQRWNGLSM